MEKRYYHKSLSLKDAQLKLDKEVGCFEGYASVFGGVDAVGDTIMRGAFADTLASKNGRIKMFYNHTHWELPVGKWIDLEEDTRGLRVRGELTPAHTQSDNLRAAMQHGTVDSLSIGFCLAEQDYEAKKNGEGKLIKRVTDLIEISVVTFPADHAARIDRATVKSEIDFLQTPQDFEQFLEELFVEDRIRLAKSLVPDLAKRAQTIFAPPASPSQSDAIYAAKQIKELFGRFTLPSITSFN